MKLFLLVLALLGPSPVHLARAQTWIQWKSSAGGNNHYYALTTFATNWTGAQILADSWGATLASITSSNEQEFINDTFLTGTFEHRPVWIGLFDRKGIATGTAERVKGQRGASRTFEWVTGEPFTYSNWKSGEPNNASRAEFYVAINWEFSDNPISGFIGEWNDTPLNGTTGHGGNTTGPYFGLMERTLDRDLPSTGIRFNWRLLLLAAAILFGVLAWRARKKASSRAQP